MLLLRRLVVSLLLFDLLRALLLVALGLQLLLLLRRPVRESCRLDFIAFRGGSSESDVVRHRGARARGMLGDDGSAVAEKVDERSGVDLANEVLQGGVPGSLGVDAEYEESGVDMDRKSGEKI